MIARRAKVLFQVIVGARKIDMIVTMKEARPIARRDFAKGGEHGREGFRRGRRLFHVRQERFVGLAHL